MAKKDKNTEVTRGQVVIREILADTGLSGASLANFLGINNGIIEDLMRGRTKRLSNNVINAISGKFPQYSKLWLLSGEGDKFVSSGQTVSNVVSPHHNASGDNISVHDGNANTEIINRLLDEIKAYRKLTQDLVDIIKKKESSSDK